ncbi:MAG: M23 family metallopeptidase, partial [Kiloniellaceae bacterium]
PVVAAGDGVIVRIGRNGNFGRYIRIRHRGVYSTAYAHLNGYAKGVRKGARVRQGQVIGYVGTSGLSTGAHLHYEVLRNGRQINPREIKLPDGPKLTGEALAAFRETRAEIARRLAALPLVHQVAEEPSAPPACGSARRTTEVAEARGHSARC